MSSGFTPLNRQDPAAAERARLAAVAKAHKLAQEKAAKEAAERLRQEQEAYRNRVIKPRGQ